MVAARRFTRPVLPLIPHPTKGRTMRTIDFPTIDFSKVEFPKVDFSKIEFPKVDFSKIEMPKVDFSKIEMPKVDFSKIEMPKVDFPKMEMPKVELPDFPAIDLDDLDEKITGLAKDAVYITIGFGVLAIQKTQVRRREVISALSDRLGATREQVEEMVKTVEKQMRDMTHRAAA
jgi:hypothetical protein